MPESESIFDPCIEEAQKLFDFYESITREANQADAHCVEVDSNLIGGSGFGCADAEDRKFIRSAQSPLWPSTHAGVTEHISLGPCRLTLVWLYPVDEGRLDDDMFRLDFSIRLEDQKITALCMRTYRDEGSTDTLFTKTSNSIVRWTQYSCGDLGIETRRAVADIATTLTIACRYIYQRAQAPESVQCLEPAAVIGSDGEYEIVQLP